MTMGVLILLLLSSQVSTPVLVGQNLLDLVKALEEQPGVAAQLAKASPFSGLRNRLDLQGLPVTFPIPFSYLAQASAPIAEKKVGSPFKTDAWT